MYRRAVTNLDVKEAVKSAKRALQELYSDDPLKDLALEEIELTEEAGRKMWAVTLGFHRTKRVSEVPASRVTQYWSLRPEPPAQVEHRVYKTVFIDADSGAFVKMDMRLLQ